MATLQRSIDREGNISGKARKRSRWMPPSLLHLTAHILAWLPLALLLVDAQSGNLSINPIQDATQRMGRAAILLLMCSLAVTPVRLLTGLRSVQTLARPLGLYAFLYVLIHMFLYLGVDYGFDLSLLLPDVADKKYIFIGLAAFLILLALAITSFRWWMKRLGKRWKQLHRLVYAAGLLVVVHYSLSVKGDILHLQGNVGKPILYAVLVVILLVIRIPSVRRRVISAREHLRALIQEKRNAV